MTVAEIERIGSPEISRTDARQAFLEYRRVLKGERDTRAKGEYEALMKGYRAIAAGQQVIDLHKVMHAAGVQEQTGYPTLAIGRADWRDTHVTMSGEGQARFTGRSTSWTSQRMAGEVRLPIDTYDRELYRRWWKQSAWDGRAKALTPMIPPAGRPTHGLSNYYILWDAVWEPQPPTDPLLLKHLGGALYAILFAWDLTPLEQAVMRGRL